MAKTVSVAKLNHGGASQAIRDAQQEPVLVTKENQPAAWIISSDRLAEIVAANGTDSDVYQKALEALAIKLYENEILTLWRATKLAGMSLHDFIDLCGRCHVQVLPGTAEEILGDVDALERLTRREQSTS